MFSLLLLSPASLLIDDVFVVFDVAVDPRRRVDYMKQKVHQNTDM